MEERLLFNKKLLRHEEDFEITFNTDAGNKQADILKSDSIQFFNNHLLSDQPQHTLNHLARLNQLLSDSFFRTENPSDDVNGLKLGDSQELKTFSLQKDHDGSQTNLFKRFDIYSEYFQEDCESKTVGPKEESNQSTIEHNLDLSNSATCELKEDSTRATFSKDKFCVISQCFWPESHFSKGYCVNYNNIEMLKMSFPDMDDVEEYLQEFYDLHGFDKSVENIQTELYICDAVYMCIFNRHEYYFAKYRDYIKYYGTIDIFQLRDKKESTMLSKKQFMNNCLWVFSMTIICLLFMALFCITIWVTEGMNELQELQDFNGNRTTSDNSTLDYTLENLPKWNYLSAFYFSAVTMLTIGYGDYSPITSAGQILVIVHAIFGIIWISLLISIIGKRLLQNINFILHFISITFERILRLIISRTRLRYILTSTIRKGFTNPFAQLLYFVLFLFLYCIVGASVFLSLESNVNESWTFLRSLYFTIISLTTIGFGDVYVTRMYYLNYLF